MNIQKVSFGSVVNVSPDRKANVVTSPLKQDFFKEEEFNTEKADKFLDGIKDKNGNSKFKDKCYKTTILNEVSGAPEKWSYVKKLATRENISPSYLSFFAQRDTDTLKKVVDIAYIDNKKGNPKFDDNYVSEIVKYDEKRYNNVKILAKTDLDSDNIIKASGEENLNCKKVAQRANEMSEFVGDDIKSLIFARDAFSKGDYTLKAKKSDKSEVSEIFDNKLNRYALETVNYYKTNDASYKIQKSVDYRNNTVSKVRYKEDKLGKFRASHEVRIVKDKDGKVKRTEYTEPSEVKGVMNVTYKYPDGREEIVSSGTIDKKTGITSVRKNMVSSLGTKTEYLFQDDPHGNRISDYKITDKNGKVLLKNSETFEVINENKFISSKNNEKYEIDVNDYMINVSDMNNPKRRASFVYGKHIQGNQEEIIKVFKQMPGEELLKLSENVEIIKGTKDVLRSYSQRGAGQQSLIYSGNDLFIILHELGHATDMKDVNMLHQDETMKNAIFEDKQFNEIYNKEKAAFNKQFPDAQRNHIAYFIDHETHYNGDIGGRKETIAESNALLTTPKSHEMLALRSQYLQQHFPETIAYLNDKLNEGKQSKKA